MSSLSQAHEMASALRARVLYHVMGHDDVIELAIIALLSGGHMLLEDHPGSGKTTLAKSLGSAIRVATEESAQSSTLGSSFQRVQFTPDMLPSDITGVMVFDGHRNDFHFRPGPIFTHVLLVDEINRTSPKVQSAMLEAMAERQVTVDNTTYHLDELFFVIATQNPLDSVGTYPLPVAQLDRFLFKVKMKHIDRDSEIAVIDAWGMPRPAVELPQITRDELIKTRAAIRTQVRIDDDFKLLLLDFASRIRADRRCRQGMSTRALVQAIPALQTYAALRGRDHVIPDDLRALALPIFAHRLTMTSGQFDVASIIEEALDSARALGLAEAQAHEEAQRDMMDDPIMDPPPDERTPTLNADPALLDLLTHEAEARQADRSGAPPHLPPNTVNTEDLTLNEEDAERYEESTQPTADEPLKRPLDRAAARAREDERRATQFFAWLAQRHQPWVTWSLLVTNIGVWVLMVNADVDLINPAPSELLAWGANYNPYTASGQWWRLCSSMFLHCGLAHLAVNMVCLLYGGKVIERILGARYFFVSYLISGLAGGLASIVINDPLVGAGASGAIYGIYGLIFGWSLTHRGVVPKAALKSLTWSAGGFIAYNLFYSFGPTIDTSAHFGGLFAGLVCGLSAPHNQRSRGSMIELKHISSLRSAMTLIGGMILLFGIAAFTPIKPDRHTILTRAIDVERDLLNTWNQMINSEWRPPTVHQAYVNLEREETQLNRKANQFNQTYKDPSSEVTAEFFKDETLPTYQRHLIAVNQLIAKGTPHPSLDQLHAYLTAKVTACQHLISVLPRANQETLTKAYQALQQANNLLTQNTQEVTGYAYAEMARVLQDEILPQWRVQIKEIRELHHALESEKVIELLLAYMEHRHTAWELYQRGASQRDPQVMNRALSAWKTAESSLKKLKEHQSR